MTNKEVKNRLKKLRIENELTQKKLHEETGFPIRSLQNWENGDRKINEENAQKLAEYFDVSVPYLLGYDEDIQIPEPPFALSTPREEGYWIDYHKEGYAKIGMPFGVYENIRKLGYTVDEVLKNSFENLNKAQLNKAVLGAVKLKSELDELAKHAKNNDITEEIKSAWNSESMANYYHELKKIMFQINVKESFSESELSEIQTLKSDLLAFIDFLYEQRLTLDKIDTDKKHDS
ncbi:helix-turn-helix domain-containing protein [Streptococcus pluranimalium]